MAEENSDTDKPHEPTQKRLDDAREKGDVPKSADITTAAGYLGLIGAMILVGGTTAESIGTTMSSLIERSDQFAVVWFDGGGLALGGELISNIGGSVLVWFALPTLIVLLAIIAQRAFIVAPSKLQPKLSRISPFSNFKNKFGRSGLFEFIKSFLKLFIYSFILFFFLHQNVEEILFLVNFDPLTIIHSLAWLTIEFLIIVTVVAATLGALDFIYQYSEHMRKNRMSRQEVTDETKQSEGDPHMKQERRQRGYDIATNRMLDDVPKADVVVVNPTHYAVALQWSRAPGSAPTCVAKGVDQVAARIREVAQEHAIPIHSDPATARAIFATVEIGGEILPDQYQAVAAAIRFAEKMRVKARAWQ